MSSFQIGPGNEISVGGETIKADARGIVTVPSEYDDVLTNCHGLTLFVEVAAPVEAPAEAVAEAETPAKAPAVVAKGKAK